MRLGIKFFLAFVLTLSLLVPQSSFAQVELNDGSTRIWMFADSSDADAQILSILVNEYPSPDYALGAVDGVIAQGWDSRYLDNPRRPRGHQLDMWCYMFTGKSPTKYETHEQGWVFACPVDVFVYVVILYGDDVQPAIEVAEDLILYDHPEVPDGWLDITDDVAG